MEPHVQEQPKLGIRSNGKSRIADGKKMNDGKESLQHEKSLTVEELKMKHYQ